MIRIGFCWFIIVLLLGYHKGIMVVIFPTPILQVLGLPRLI